MADRTQQVPTKLSEAKHKGWLAGVALRLVSNVVTRNPYERDSEEWICWEMGFEEGFAG
jgi:hypothetical protein